MIITYEIPQEEEKRVLDALKVSYTKEDETDEEFIRRITAEIMRDKIALIEYSELMRKSQEINPPNIN